jgi:hypothetical protein
MREHWVAADAAHERPRRAAAPRTSHRNGPHDGRTEGARACDGASHGVGTSVRPGYFCSTAAMPSTFLLTALRIRHVRATAASLESMTWPEEPLARPLGAS